MTAVKQTAHQRAPEVCEKRIRILNPVRWIISCWQTRKHPTVTSLNRRLARDIGLSDAELARRQFRWPSQTMHHPRG